MYDKKYLYRCFIDEEIKLYRVKKCIKYKKMINLLIFLYEEP